MRRVLVQVNVEISGNTEKWKNKIAVFFMVQTQKCSRKYKRKINNVS